MATPTVVQAKNNQTVAAGTTGVKVTITTTSGNLLVLFASQDSSSSLNATINDSASQTWTLAGSVTVGSGKAVMYYVPNSASIGNVTVTWNTSSSITLPCVVYEVSGAATSTPLDGNASNPATSSLATSGTSLTSGTLSTNNANCILMYGVGLGGATGTWTAGGGYSFASGGSISSGRAAVETLGVSSTQSSVTTSMSWGSSNGDRLGILAAFSDTNQVVFVPDEDFLVFTPPPTNMNPDPCISVW